MFIPIFEEENEKYWIPKDLKKGALHRALGIPEDQKIPLKKLLALKKKLQNIKEKEGKLTKSQRTLLRRVVLALTFRGFHKK